MGLLLEHSGPKMLTLLKGFLLDSSEVYFAHHVRRRGRKLESRLQQGMCTAKGLADHTYKAHILLYLDPVLRPTLGQTMGEGATPNTHNTAMQHQIAPHPFAQLCGQVEQHMAHARVFDAIEVTSHIPS